jgi:hypothetical protein
MLDSCLGVLLYLGDDKPTEQVPPELRPFMPEIFDHEAFEQLEVPAAEPTVLQTASTGPSEWPLTWWNCFIGRVNTWRCPPYVRARELHTVANPRTPSDIRVGAGKDAPVRPESNPPA